MVSMVAFMRTSHIDADEALRKGKIPARREAPGFRAQTSAEEDYFKLNDTRRAWMPVDSETTQVITTLDRAEGNR